MDLPADLRLLPGQPIPGHRLSSTKRVKPGETDSYLPDMEVRGNPPGSRGSGRDQFSNSP